MHEIYFMYATKRANITLLICVPIEYHAERKCNFILQISLMFQLRRDK